ncbi:hypothetical protein BTG84_16015 [Acinetobacter baumannii]|nr:hypothetical protein LX00_17710 [Acinetobacter baumannii]RSC54224.1 hypothetical protein EGT34_10275 [Acinetobacter sp. FDAARGOS_558]AVO90316.1 hypothetical protein AM480_05240 [Acinetobacter baumannii]KQD81703.1 hypothetical protein APD27_15340 [Acinetobacter baumannii]KQK33127.1 hypothetical protein AQ483_17510 [Acinetobacter baumannii]
MGFISFIDFFLVFVFITSIVLSIIWVFSKRNNPYIHWFDKILVLFFIPVISLSFFLILIISTEKIVNIFI